MINFLKKSGENSGDINLNIFTQNSQPEGYNGIWIKSDSFNYNSIVGIADKNEVVVSSINILDGTQYETVLCHSDKANGFSYKFKKILLTDSMNNIIYDIPIYYGNGNSWIDITPLDINELEYIESTGTQYINTNIDLQNVTNFSMELSFAPTSLDSSYNEYLTATSAFELFSKNSGISIKFNGTRSNDFATLNLNTRNNFTISLSNNNLTVKNNETVLTTLSNVSQISSSKIVDIARYKENSEIYYAKMKIYSFRFYKNNELMLDLIPAKDPLGTICLYDKVSKEYFYNAGTGKFTTDPLSDLHYLEYIRSTGTQYIDTLIRGTDNTIVEIKSANTYTNPGQQALMGARNFNNGTSSAVFLGFYQNGWVCFSNKEGNIGNIINRTSILILEKNLVYEYNEDTGVKTLLYNLPVPSGFTTPSDMVIFAERRGNTVYSNSEMSLFYCKIWNDKKLLRNFVPARDANGVTCLYDRVSNQCFYNLGTGDFIAGSEI